MTLGADDIQPASIKRHLFCGGNFGDHFSARRVGERFFLRRLCQTHVKIAAQLNIGTTTGHIGRDCHCTRHPGIGNDFGFFIMHPGVQNLVRNFTFGELG